MLVAFSLFTSHAYVVGRPFTTSAEVLLAAGAAHAEHAHMVGGLLGNDLARLIFLLVVGSRGLKLEDGSAVAADQLGIEVNPHFHLAGLN